MTENECSKGIDLVEIWNNYQARRLSKRFTYDSSIVRQANGKDKQNYIIYHFLLE